MRDAAAIVVAAGRGGRPGESRLDLLKENARVVRDLATAFRNFTGVVIVVTNPVDVLTHEFATRSGLPPERVPGTGTMLDTARLRDRLSRALHVAAQSIHAHVVGEHGDSEVVRWSSATVAGVPLARWPGWKAEAEPVSAMSPSRCQRWLGPVAARMSSHQRSAITNKQRSIGQPPFYATRSHRSPRPDSRLATAMFL
jgi:L-lactate dehydrogenase